MQARRLAGVLVPALVLAGCASPTGPAQWTAASPTSTLAAFGVPVTLGQWQLVAEVQPIDPAGPTAAIITAAGGTPAAATDVNVQVTGGSDRLAFDALRAPGVTLDAFTKAAEPRIAALGTIVRSETSVSGWKVVRYSTPVGGAGPPRVLAYASQGDVIYTFADWSDEQLATLLAGVR